MKYTLSILIILLIHFSTQAQSVKLMIITGGQTYDSLAFFHMFDRMEDVEYEHFIQPVANRKISQNYAEGFDLIVFFDQWQVISETEKLAYLQMAEQGKPMLFLHQSLMSYQNWPAFEQILGGRFVMEGKNVPEEDISEAESDVWEYCFVENYNGITAGFQELRFFDEIYENVRISENVFPLLRIRHPKSMEYVAWENRFKNSRIVYIQPGYDKRTFEEPNYNKLLLQAIRYLTKM